MKKFLQDCTEEVEYTENAIQKFKAVEKERDYFTKYILIYISGTLEISYKTLISDYCLRHSHAPLHSFFENTIIKSSKNATFDNICDLLKQIDCNLKTEFKKHINKMPNSEQIKDSLKSLGTLRHSFAHGNNTTTFSFKDIKIYYSNAHMVIEQLDDFLHTYNNQHVS